MISKRRNKMSDYEYPKSPEKTIFIKNGEGKNLKEQKNILQEMLK
ncbi:hypothetical protein Bint_1273 [Brachyspira intermedia PWS/A]|uniref:Uncharacterized protein n=1 Tax=Brachyspira intermedia (strain ATCC 51140 / PWS/A) TaxID=1045858 RepID=G0ENL3_BRAIP|nr:hypothetical protein Bint_1273 [Brachyspira intermedia PWS/A]